MRVYGLARLTKEIELKYSTSGTAYLMNGIACDRKYKKDGEPTADFFNIKAFGKTAEAMNQYLHKGSKVFIEGDLQTETYTDKAGNKKTSTAIFVTSWEFAESKGSGSVDPVEQAKNTDFLKVPEGLIEELPFS